MAKTLVPANEEERAEAAFERFGTRKPRCSVPGCPVTDWRAMTGDDPDHLLCYEHSRMSQRRTPVESAHLIGHQDEQLQIPMLGNLHRAFDDPKHDWPEKTRMNPEGSPLLKAAACVRAACDWLRVIVVGLLGWAAHFLESLDERLSALHGPRWWETIGLAGWAEATGGVP